MPQKKTADSGRFVSEKPTDSGRFESEKLADSGRFALEKPAATELRHTLKRTKRLLLDGGGNQSLFFYITPNFREVTDFTLRSSQEND